MPTATLNRKGQIIVPLTVRTALGLHAGITLDFVVEGDGFKVVPLRNAATTLNGRFTGRVVIPVNLAAMDEAIASEAASRPRTITKS